MCGAGHLVHYTEVFPDENKAEAQMLLVLKCSRERPVLNLTTRTSHLLSVTETL